jgi:hypothetical protein
MAGDRSIQLKFQACQQPSNYLPLFHEMIYSDAGIT